MTFAGYTIILTRPAGQALALRERLQALDATVELHPLLNVRELPPKPLARLHWDDIIFISPNAVKWGLAHVDTHQANIFAIGPSTAQALHDAGLANVITPANQYNSESLVATAELADVKNHHVAIVRGEGGRDHLQTTLQQRGATVELINVYQRHGAPVDLVRWGNLGSSGRSDSLSNGRSQPMIITISSVAALEHLCEQIEQQQCKPLFDVPVVVSSPRMVKHAHALGFSQVWCGDDATDTGLIAALDRCITEQPSQGAQP